MSDQQSVSHRLGQGDQGDQGDQGAQWLKGGDRGIQAYPMADALSADDFKDPPWENAEIPSYRFPIISLPDHTYPDSGWDASNLAQLVLAQFGQTKWTSKITLPPYDPTKTDNELRDLADMIQVMRPKRLAEIIAQSGGASDYFCHLLMHDAGSYPKTHRLIVTAFTIASHVGMYFKDKFKRPRPVQLLPALLPPIPTPGHAAYPSGHALQSALAAKCIATVYPPMTEVANALAGRIAFNREVAGLHYPSDKVGSYELVPQIWDHLLKCSKFNDMLSDAKAEWPQ